MNHHLGVKFVTEFLKKEILSDLRLEDLKYWISRFGFYDLCQPFEGRSYGNMSFRVSPGSGEFIITATEHGLKENMTNDKFVKVVDCDINNNKVKVHGLELPSSETFIHHMIYNERPDVNAIFHGHCEKLECDPNLKFRSTEHEHPHETIELAREVLRILGKENFIVMKNHGFLSLGKDIDDAGKVTLRAYQKCFQ